MVIIFSRAAMAFYEDIVIDQNNKTKCELCHIFLTTSSIELHLNDKNHNRLFMERMMIRNGITITGKNVNCFICEEVSDLSTVIDHLKSVKHNAILDGIKQTTLKDGGFLILPENITNQGATVACLICDRSVTFNLNKIKTHITSERHRRARSIAIQPLNAIFSVEDSNDDLWCKICQVYFENYIETVFEHVDEDRKHIEEVNKLFSLTREHNICIDKFIFYPKEDKAYCNKCSMEVPCNLDNLRKHVGGKKHQS